MPKPYAILAAALIANGRSLSTVHAHDTTRASGAYTDLWKRGSVHRLGQRRHLRLRVTPRCGAVGEARQ